MGTNPLPIDIPPGIVKVDSPNAAHGRYTDCDHVRFIKNRAQKWRGWIKLITNLLLGTARGATSWIGSLGDQNIAVGTNLKLYVIQSGDDLIDITPIRRTVTLTNPFTTTNGSAVILVNDPNHGASTNDFVTFSGAVVVGGLLLNIQVQITVIDNNNYSFTNPATVGGWTTKSYWTPFELDLVPNSPAPATSSATGGGTVTATYQINTGPESNIEGFGYGAGTYGSGTYGTPRTTSVGVVTELRSWSVQGYGKDLLASPSGGTLYLYDESIDSVAVAVANAPASARAMFVTGERYVFMLGTTTPMTVQWPSQTDITAWNADLTNTANIRTLQSGSKLMGGCRVADGLALIWSDDTLYLFQYSTTDSFVYDDRIVGEKCGLLAPLAFCAVSGIAYWMSGHDFHQYNGAVSQIQNGEDMREFVFQDLDPNYSGKTWCLYDETNNQVRWHYVSLESTTTEPDKYVDVSLYDFSWTTGTLDRTSGTHWRPSDPASVVMVSSGGNVYLHENGLDADGAALQSSLQFGLYDILEGDVNVDVFGLIPDFERQSGELQITITGKDHPDSPGNIDTFNGTLAQNQDIIDARVCGRHFSFEVISDEIGGDFRFGIPHLEVQQGGERR